MHSEEQTSRAFTYVKSRKADLASMKKSPHVPLRQIAEEKRRGKELGVL